jgi:hypothetical protein
MNKAESAKKLVEEILSIKDQYQMEVGSRRKPWPKSIKVRILELDRLGMPMLKISESIKIPYQTIMHWRFMDRKNIVNIDSKKNFHTVAVKNPTVTVGKSLAKVPASKIPLLDPIVTVRTPDGYILEIPSKMAAQFLSEIRNRK